MGRPGRDDPPEVPPEISLSTLEAILDLETIEVAPRAKDGASTSARAGDGSAHLDIFRGKNLREGRFTPRTFGGQLVGQSLVAASRTVDPRMVPHSLHSYFLLPGDAYVPYVYTVERLRDGRSFATRRVVARQKGQAVFHMSVSFQAREEGFTHQSPMPCGVPPPESVPSQEELARRFKDDPRVPDAMRGYLRKRLMLPFPIDLRIIRASVGGEDEGGDAQEPWLAPLIAGDSRSVRAAAEAKQMAWIRAPKLGDDPTLHYCVAAYSSDFALLETSLLPHRQTIPSPQIQAASLDHSMWFHAPFRADEWLLYVMTSPAASGGRGLTFGRLYNRSGTLVCTVAQEGLIRKLNTGQGMKRGFQSRSKL